MITRLRILGRNVVVLARALRHPETPIAARAWIIAVFAYVISPVDLVPDIVPAAGVLDDLVVLPLGVLLGTRMIPETVLEECQPSDSTRTARAIRWTIFLSVLALWGGLVLLLIIVLR